MDNKVIDILEFIPEKIISSKDKKEIRLQKKFIDKYVDLLYITKHNNGGYKEHSIYIPRYISRNIRTFEVLGLLQAEMGKTNNGCLSFSNHEPKIVNYILNWFEKELELNKNEWKWSIKLNLQEPIDENYKKEIEQKVIDHWLNKTKITLEQSYPKKVTYIKDTTNKKLKFYDEGTLVLEYKNNLFSQLIKNLVKKITYENILNYEIESIQAYMRGIIAGESSIHFNKKTGHFTVHISACNNEERLIYRNCLIKLNIEIKTYLNYKEMLISKRENNIQLLNQRLMTLSQEKYAKFRNMMKQYPDITEETGYFKQKGINSWNRIHKNKIDEIIKIYNSGIVSTKEIANKLNLHILKVQRALKENNLGRRLIKTAEEKRKQIVEFAKNNPHIRQYKIANHFNVNKAVVSRAIRKYNIQL